MSTSTRTYIVYILHTYLIPTAACAKYAWMPVSTLYDSYTQRLLLDDLTGFPKYSLRFFFDRAPGCKDYPALCLPRHG